MVGLHLASAPGYLIIVPNKNDFQNNKNLEYIHTLLCKHAYGLSVKENNLFLTDASFSAQSTLKVYDLPSGTLSESFSVGIGASKIYFN